MFEHYDLLSILLTGKTAELRPEIGSFGLLSKHCSQFNYISLELTIMQAKSLFARYWILLRTDY